MGSEWKMVDPSLTPPPVGKRSNMTVYESRYFPFAYLLTGNDCLCLLYEPLSPASNSSSLGRVNCEKGITGTHCD